ncbi:yellow-3 [Tribolium castaneum]|uniref:Yellow-3 n=1 Tax=Tribolium castaneum TaxID=7070 RepID=D1LZL2_TRICA|nr:yellow-3 [Tribolium castaneum]ACY71066.1 yellow-3 [Tribolium castaneum]|eukprot:NP_001161785.1 yellow-3 [Tribolium castaneum]
MNPLCAYLGYLFVNYCLNDKVQNEPIKPIKNQTFQLEYQWHYVNYTWPTYEDYKKAVIKRKYVPENVAITGIKYHKGDLYLAMPQIRKGVPVTLGKISTESAPKSNPLVHPYPSWEHQPRSKDCTTLQSVQNMEIDKSGVMWVLDGFRINNNTRCPPKLVLFDLNNDGKELLSYIFPKDICSSQGGHLKDIVIDSTNDGFAYITDNSFLDPGLIVYSRGQNRAWKLRDRTMFDEEDASGFVVGNLTFKGLAPLDGIALSPIHPKTRNRLLFYSPLAGMNLYAIKSKVLKSERLINSGDWRRAIKVVGKKQSQSDGLIMDNKGNLYYTLPPLYGVGKWNMHEEFSTAKIMAEDKNMVWTGSFAFDESGNLRLLTNNINKYMDAGFPLKLSQEVMFKIFKYFTGTKSYLES